MRKCKLDVITNMRERNSTEIKIEKIILETIIMKEIQSRQEDTIISETDQNRSPKKGLMKKLLKRLQL